MISLPSTIERVRSLASLRVKSSRAITWLVNALVEATPISGPAWT